jgi:hypothetical protein
MTWLLRAASLACCIVAGLLVSDSPALAGTPGLEVGFERVPLGAFVAKMREAIGSPIVHGSPLAGIVAVRSAGLAGPEQARQLLASIVELHGLRMELRADGTIELIALESERQKYWKELEAAALLYRPTALLDRLTGRAPFAHPAGGDSIAIVGPRGFVALRRSGELDLEASSTLLALLSATPSAADHPTPLGGSYARAIYEPNGAISIDLHRVDTLSALGLGARRRGWRLVSDPEALPPVLVDYHASDPTSDADVESLGRALLALGGYELAEGSNGILYPRPRARAPGAERISSAVAARLSSLLVEPAEHREFIDRRDGLDLSRVLALSERSASRIVLDESCPRLISVTGREIEVTELAALVRTVVDSHDLVAREAASGDIELVPRVSCPIPRGEGAVDSPHPALAQVGVRSGDQILAIDGTPVTELQGSDLLERLRRARSTALDLRSASGEKRRLWIPAATLLDLLDG